MQKKLSDFPVGLGLTLTPAQWQQLKAYADLIWQKKDQLNLTSVSDKNEIFTRHIADGFAVACVWKRFFDGYENGTVADMGSGAGYIGITLAIMCPQVQVTLVESLQKRSLFLNWAILKLGLSNVVVKNMRLGQQSVGVFDLITERAMGPLEELLPLLVPCSKKGGVIAAYQSQAGQLEASLQKTLSLQEEEPLAYQLPDEKKCRFITVLTHGYC